MAGSTTVREFNTFVDCPACGQEHQVAGNATIRPVSVFIGGGAGGGLPEGAAWTEPIVCPSTGIDTEVSLSIPRTAGERIGSVSIVAIRELKDAIDATAATPRSLGDGDWIDRELEALRTSSIDTGRSYATTLLGANSGAIPIYFSVLKFLGVGVPGAGWLVFLLVPPVLFLIAIVTQVQALRPALRQLSRDNFIQAREERLARSRRWLDAGIALFCVGTGLAIIAFALALRELPGGR